jgi:cytochrome b561
MMTSRGGKFDAIAAILVEWDAADNRASACIKNNRQIMDTHSGSSARPKNGTGRYAAGAIAIHWVMALLIVGVGVLGLLHDSWPKRTQAFWINIHALLGLLVWVLLIVRFWWRSRHAPPALPPGIGEFSRRLSVPAHWLLYGLMFVLPIIGIVTFIWHGRAMDFGLFQIHFGIRSNRAIFHPTEDIHGYLAYALFALAAIHASAALWHHFVRHDGVLRRMWPSSAESQTAP